MPGKFNEAIEWYELQSKGLGQRFKKSVIEHIDKIKMNPDWFLIEADTLHSAASRKFKVGSPAERDGRARGGRKLCAHIKHAKACHGYK